MSGILGGIAGNLAGGNIGRAVVSLVLDTTGYNSQLEKTKAETIGTTEQMGTATSGFGAISTAAYATAAVGALEFAKSAVAAASEHQQAIAALTAQVGENTKAFEDQATALQNVSGFQDEAILGADTILARFKLTQQQIQDTIPTVLDYARATGKTAPDAAQTIGKALLGNTRALKAIGIAYTSTGDAATDFANIQELINQKVGGQAAAYAQTYAGKLEILSARFDDFKEAVGGALLEDLSNLADDLIIVADGIDKLNVSVPKVGGSFNILKGIMAPFTLTLDYTHAVLGKVGDALGITADSTEGLTQAQQGLVDATTGMTEVEYQAAAAATHLTAAQKDLRDAVRQAGDGILSLTTTVKDTFDISTKEMNKGFSQMLASAIRFKKDMRILENLDIGLGASQTARFEQFLVSQGPGYVDRFVNASKQKQDKWVAQWEQSVASINQATAGIKPVSIRVNSSELDHALAQSQRLQQQLNRVGL